MTRMSPSAPEKSVDWHVIFVASSTPEKLRDFQEIAKAKCWPIIFADARDIFGVFHNVDENGGTIKANAKLKKEAIEKFVNALRKDDVVVADWCAKHGVKYDPSRVCFMTEDGGFNVDKNVWDGVVAQVKQSIPQKTLNKIGNKGGPGVETAPVLSAVMGAKNLMRHTINSAEKIQKAAGNSKPFSVEEYIKVEFIPMCAGQKAPDIEGNVTNYLRFPEEGTRLGPRVSTYDYFRPKVNPYKTATQLGLEYITEHSARAQIVDKIATELFGLSEAKKHTPGKRFSLPGEEFSIGLLSNDAHPDRHGNFTALARNLSAKAKEGRFAQAKIQSFGTGGEQNSEADATSRAANALSYVEKLLAESDAVVLPPAADSSDQTRFTNLYTLMSMVVAKQLEPRDAIKPIIIMNHKPHGETSTGWDEAVALHYDLVNQGLTKEHSILLHADSNGNKGKVDVHSNSYFHVLTGSKLDKIEETAAHILDEARKGFVRRAAQKVQTYAEGDAPETSQRFNVAIFCSASCENETLNNSVKKLSHDLANEHYGIIYGGGDRYTMGAVIAGVRQYRKESGKEAYIAGISTDPISIAETEKGELPPDLNYRELTKDIYERMAKMLAGSNALVVAPGGAGTVQEWMGAMILRKQMPEEFGDKPIVIYNPKLLDDSDKKVWDEMLKFTLGEDYDFLTQDHTKLSSREKERFETRCRKHGIYVETTEAGVKARLEEFRGAQLGGYRAMLGHNSHAQVGSGIGL